MRPLFFVSACVLLVSFSATLLPSAAFAGGTLPSKPRGHISDYANALSGSDSLERELSVFREAYGMEVHVVLLASLPDRMSMEEAARTLYAQWPTGASPRDDGVLLLAVLDQKQARIQAGYGLRDVFNDDAARELLQEYLAPAFARGSYDQGVRDATHAMLRLLERNKIQVRASVTSGGIGVAAIVIPGILVVVVLFFLLIRKRCAIRTAHVASAASRARQRIVTDL